MEPTKLSRMESRLVLALLCTEPVKFWRTHHVRYRLHSACSQIFRLYHASLNLTQSQLLMSLHSAQFQIYRLNDVAVYPLTRCLTLRSDDELKLLAEYQAE